MRQRGYGFRKVAIGIPLTGTPVLISAAVRGPDR
jgi:hypothetical protein